MNESDLQEIVNLNLYEILDIKKNSSKKEIKDSFKRLVKRLHPDKPTGDSEAFEIVNLAYTVLKSDKLRIKYNELRKEYLESKNFIDFKNESKISETKFFLSKDEAKKKFKELEVNLNKKHNYNKDENKLSSSELNKRLQDLTFNRKNFENDIKEKNKKSNINKTNFNDKFLSSSLKQEKNNEIIEYNGLLSLNDNYCSINSFELYSEQSKDSNYYSNLESAFNNFVPINVKNNYSDHNILSDFDKSEIQKKMSDLRKNYN